MMTSSRILTSTTRQLTHRLRAITDPSITANVALTRTRALFFSATPTASDIFSKITFLGTGKMAQSMLSPLINRNLQAPSSITAFDVSDAALRRVEQLYPGVQTASSITEAISDAQLIVYAVKPQNVEKVHAEIRRAKYETGNVREDATLLSVVAGKPIHSFVEGSGVQRVARSMPNTPAQIGAGVTVWSYDESFIDMSTSISGSGPAYIFLLMEAMIDAGVHMGFSRETATTLVHHTLLGSTKFAMETGEHPAVLRNSVTSPAGTTASAIYELENGKFRTVIKDAIWACYRRSLEMGGQSSQVGPGRQQPSYGIISGGVVGGTDSPVIVDLNNVASVEEMAETIAPMVPGVESGHHPREPPSGEMRGFDEDHAEHK
eukprot:g13718.t1 g13718   contig9:260793-262146(-)